MAERERRRWTPRAVVRGIRAGVGWGLCCFVVLCFGRYVAFAGLLRLVGWTGGIANVRGLAGCSALLGIALAWTRMRSARSYGAAGSGFADAHGHRVQLVRDGGRDPDSERGPAPRSDHPVLRWAGSVSASRAAATRPELNQ